MENDVLRYIRERRSIRKFKEQQIETEARDMILEAATWAPSGGNSQSWLFTVIQSKEKLLHLNDLVREAFQHWVPDDNYPAKHAVKGKSSQEGYSFYYHAPTLVVLSNRPHYENAMADCSLALENMFITAQSLGLGSCYINQLHWLRHDPKVRAYLGEMGIPAEHTICSSAAIGYIAAETPPSPRKEGTIRIIS